jgi:outer membrane protein assembly factor BamE (lipoprotein component of BamABCDE complex)
MRALTSASWILLVLLAARPVVAGDEKDQEFTLGLVQKELRVGMSQTEVMTALGSPNVLTRSGEGREAWVYDRVATEVRVHDEGVSSRVGVLAPGLVFGMAGGHVRDGRTQTRQRTLTVVVKFDVAGTVESFSFHASRF